MINNFLFRKTTFLTLISLSILVSCTEKIPFCIHEDTTSPQEDTLTTPSQEGNPQNTDTLLDEEHSDGQGNQTIAPFWPEVIPFELGYELVKIYPHDPQAFTQGLVYIDGMLYESTGLYGRSSVRKVELESGNPLLNKPLPTEFQGAMFTNLFGEGLTVLPPLVYQLTWKNRVCFVYTLDLELLRVFSYEGEGWGLTHHKDTLIMSNGTEYIRFIEPETFKIKREIRVLEKGKPVFRLNELEFIEGYICANVWQEDYIVVIHPDTGEVVGRILLYGLKQKQGNNQADVLNGIAYLPDKKHLLVTGKLWDSLFEIKLVSKN